MPVPPDWLGLTDIKSRAVGSSRNNREISQGISGILRGWHTSAGVDEMGQVESHWYKDDHCPS
jgi:hypothetical protein